MTRYEVATLGEGQLRLTVPSGDRLRSARSLGVVAAGSEANVAGLLAQLGHRTTWASLVPHGDLGDRVLSEYRGTGVDLSHVVRTESGRLALYFLEPAAGDTPARVIYDREHTPLRSADPSSFDWDALLDTRLLFVTGITAALSPRTADLVSYAVQAAAERDVEVVLDVNYRTSLWTPEDAEKTLRPLLPKVDILMCSRSDAQRVFGIFGEGPQVAATLAEIGNAVHVISTDGTRGVSYRGPSGTVQVPVTAATVVDRPGAGDAFIGGVLHGHLEGDIIKGLGYGLRTATIALTHHGDLTHVSIADLATPGGTDIVR